MRLVGDVAFAVADRRQQRPLRDFAGQRVHAVAGIGHPERFFAQLRAAGIEVIPRPFDDHFPYAERDLYFGDGLPVLMTEKDAVKCRAYTRLDLWSVPVRADLPDSFFDAVARYVRQARTAAG